jgi:hypothetical protein
MTTAHIAPTTGLKAGGRTTSTLLLVAVASALLTFPSANAQDAPHLQCTGSGGPQCIEFAPQLADYGTLKGSLVNGERLTATAISLLADVEHPNDLSEAVSIDGLHSVTIFRAATGRFVVRLVKVPPDHGWFGPW